MSELSIAKRRAIAARLLTCALPPLVVMAGAASAAAAPPTPRLVTTNPASAASAPAESLTPAILGEAEPEDGIIIEAFPSASGPLAGSTSTVKRPTQNPSFEIEIFSGAGCLGAPIRFGTAEGLEGSGVPVQVGADSESTFSAKQVNPAAPSEPSGCSNALTYWEGEVAPSRELPSGGGSENGGEEGGGGTGSGQASGGLASGPPSAVGTATPAGGKPDAPQIHTSPGGRANVLTPVVLGSAPRANSVTVYASDNCTGTPVAKGTPAELSSGFAVSVPPNADTVFSAVSQAAQRSSCSSSVTYTEDSSAPRTRVTMGPGVKTRKRNAVFRFKDITSDPPGTAFVCKVDKAKWKHCSSPFHAKHLKPGKHVIQIRATDLAGNVERHPVKRRFRVVPRP